MSRKLIKFIAIICMTLCHIGKIFFVDGSAICSTLSGIGNFTAITMCYFLVEGYHRTSSVTNYMKRMLVFAIIAQIPFSLAFNFYMLNMLFTLLLCLLLLSVMEKTTNSRSRIIYIVALILLSSFCDWSFLAPVFVILFEKARSGKLNFKTAWIACIILFVGETVWYYIAVKQFSVSYIIIETIVASIGIIAAAIIVGKKYDPNKEQPENSGRFSKYFFYIYYPAHLLVLYLIKLFIV